MDRSFQSEVKDLVWCLAIFLCGVYVHQPCTVAVDKLIRLSGKYYGL